MAFYLGIGLQLIGLASVGLCFISGVSKGDYGSLELVQLVAGSLVFYLGAFVKNRAGSFK